MKCETCQKDQAARIWIQAFGSFNLAKMSGQGPELISAFLPGPGLLKIEMCLSCRSFKPCLDFTDDEKKAMEEYVKTQEAKVKVDTDFAKAFGKGWKA